MPPPTRSIDAVICETLLSSQCPTCDAMPRHATHLTACRTSSGTDRTLVKERLGLPAALASCWMAFTTCWHSFTPTLMAFMKSCWSTLLPPPSSITVGWGVKGEGLSLSFLLSFSFSLSKESLKSHTHTHTHTNQFLVSCRHNEVERTLAQFPACWLYNHLPVNESHAHCPHRTLPWDVWDCQGCWGCEEMFVCYYCLVLRV